MIAMHRYRGHDPGQGGTPSRGTIDMTEMGCPACGVTLFGPTVLDRPYVCINCRAMLVLDADLVRVPLPFMAYTSGPNMAVNVRLRRPTDAEEVAFIGEPEVQHLIAEVARYHAEHGMPSAQKYDDQ